MLSGITGAGTHTHTHTKVNYLGYAQLGSERGCKKDQQNLFIGDQLALSMRCVKGVGA